MKIIHLDPFNLKIFEQSVACIGYFDGVHRGHQALINKTRQEASIRKVKCAVITFNRDPIDVIGFSHKAHLSDLKTKNELFAKFGVDIVYYLNFDEKFANLTAFDFFNNVLLKMKLKALVAGYDFHFGYKGEGDSATLAKMSFNRFDYYEIAAELEDNLKISSSRIKLLLEEGNIEKANELLNYTYFLEGNIVKGRQNGHKIDFPTINVVATNSRFILKKGVYGGFGLIDHEKKFKAMINYGDNPTFNGINNTLEAHLLNCHEDLYGHYARIYFSYYIRDEIHFKNVADLKAQLARDREYVIRR